MARALPLDQVTAHLRQRGLKGSLAENQGRLYWRCTATGSDGVRKSRRVALGLPADPGELLEAESRVVQLAAAMARGGTLPDQLPWEAEDKPSTRGSGGQAGTPTTTTNSAVTVADATALLEADFWKGKVRTSAAERTWDRIAGELRRLPAGATLTLPLLLAVASATTAGSRTRLESVKVLKRLARCAGLEGAEQLDALRTPYEPGERNLPSEEQLRELLERLPAGHKYSWATWALATYGCRPSEVFSLTPAEDGTARVLTVKRKGKLPVWRTALALPLAPAPGARSVPLEVASPSAYDSLEAKRVTGAWGKWWVAFSGGVQLYDLRHAWAVRSIRQAVPTGLAARCMGHDIGVHTKSYHRWLDQADVAAFAAARSYAAD